MASWRYGYDAHYTCQQNLDNNLGVKSYLKISLNTSDKCIWNTGKTTILKCLAQINVTFHQCCTKKDLIGFKNIS